MAAQIIARHSEVPQLLLRAQQGLRVRLRKYAAGRGLRRETFYDVKLGEDGLVHPSPVSKESTGPNGIYLFPPGGDFQEMLDYFRKEPVIFRLKQGTKLPPYFVLLHDHVDMFSLQTLEPVSPTVLNKRMTAFLGQFPRMTVKEYLQEFGL